MFRIRLHVIARAVCGVLALAGCSYLQGNNEAAEAACIARGDSWSRSEQACKVPFSKLLNKPNNQAAEAACIGRGGTWFTYSQSCIGPLRLNSGSSGSGGGSFNYGFTEADRAQICTASGGVPAGAGGRCRYTYPADAGGGYFYLCPDGTGQYYNC